MFWADGWWFSFWAFDIRCYIVYYTLLLLYIIIHHYIIIYYTLIILYLILYSSSPLFILPSSSSLLILLQFYSFPTQHSFYTCRYLHILILYSPSSLPTISSRFGGEYTLLPSFPSHPLFYLQFSSNLSSINSFYTCRYLHILIYILSNPFQQFDPAQIIGGMSRVV